MIMAKSNQMNEKETAVKKDQTVAKKKGKDKEKKPNIFVRMGRKIKETFSELKRVTWPTLPAALKATGVVIGIVLLFLIVVTAVNSGFTALLNLLSPAKG